MSAIYSLRWARDVVEYIVWEVDRGVYRGYIPTWSGVEGGADPHHREGRQNATSNMALQRRGEGNQKEA